MAGFFFVLIRAFSLICHCDKMPWILDGKPERLVEILNSGQAGSNVESTIFNIDQGLNCLDDSKTVFRLRSLLELRPSFSPNRNS